LVNINRAESCALISRIWPAKNTSAVSMMANSSRKNIGATIANSTAADPRRLRLNRRANRLAADSRPGVDGIDQSSRIAGIIHRLIYPKLIVEVFRRIDTERPAPLTAR
jgi:hypothetical protein